MPLLIHLEKIDVLNEGQLPNIIILYHKRREEGFLGWNVVSSL